MTTCQVKVLLNKCTDLSTTTNNSPLEVSNGTSGEMFRVEELLNRYSRAVPITRFSPGYVSGFTENTG